MVTRKKDEPPSVRAERIEAERQRIKENEKAEADRIKRSLRRAFSTKDGLVALDWLRRECGFGEPILGADSNGDIDPERTVYGAMRLNLYLKLRKQLTFNILKEVEYVDN